MTQEINPHHQDLIDMFHLDTNYFSQLQHIYREHGQLRDGETVVQLNARHVDGLIDALQEPVRSLLLQHRPVEDKPEKLNMWRKRVITVYFADSYLPPCNARFITFIDRDGHVFDSLYAFAIALRPLQSE